MEKEKGSFKKKKIKKKSTDHRIWNKWQKFFLKKKKKKKKKKNLPKEKEIRVLRILQDATDAALKGSFRY